MAAEKKTRVLPAMREPLPEMPSVVARHTSGSTRSAWLFANRLYGQFTTMNSDSKKELNRTKRRIAPMLLFCLHYLERQAQLAISTLDPSSSVTDGDPHDTQATEQWDQINAQWAEVQVLARNRITVWSTRQRATDKRDVNNADAVCELVKQNQPQHVADRKFWWQLLAYEYADTIYQEMCLRDGWGDRARHMMRLMSGEENTLGNAWDYVGDVYQLLYSYVCAEEDEVPPIMSRGRLEIRLNKIIRYSAACRQVEQ